jgi:hypothetical protein
MRLEWMIPVLCANLLACGKHRPSGEKESVEASAALKEAETVEASATPDEDDRRADPDDPRLEPAPYLAGAAPEPGPVDLWRYLLQHADTPISRESFCDHRLGDGTEEERTLGGLLSSYLGNSSGEGRAFLEIGCGAGEPFAIADSPACPADAADDGCLSCALVIQLDQVTEDPAIFLVYGKLLFQYRPSAPLDPASLFCVEAG